MTDYVSMMRMQKHSAEVYGHEHLVITDADLGSEFNSIKTNLGPDVMQAMIRGAIYRLGLGGGSHVVLCDADCLVVKDLESAFYGDEFDLALTRRENVISPINNGVMYVNRAGQSRAAEFFKVALDLCGSHWGGDQEAISLAAAPVPGIGGGIGKRHGCLVQFVSMKRHAAVPKQIAAKHGERTYVVHFKGATKDWMPEYFRLFVPGA